MFEPEELRAAFNDRTRAIIINTPNNPTGRVFTRAELQLIADLCLQHDVIVIADEVYEHLLFDNARHIPIASLPGMFERTVTVGSAGKTFGMTGWKIGWVYGPPDLITGAWRSIQFTSFATNHPAQVGVAHGFAMGSSYYEEYQALYHGKRALMMDLLAGAGMKSILPQGTYFVMADFSELFDGDDVAFTFATHDPGDRGQLHPALGLFHAGTPPHHQRPRALHLLQERRHVAFAPSYRVNLLT